jgi:riboflavin kinase/FMN adenylyltransferase
MSARLVLVDDATRDEALGARECVLVIGNFDGVHRGHRAVLEQAVSVARAAGLAACALTFDPHPAQVVGRRAPPLLTSVEDRVELVGALGVDCVYVRRFDAAFAEWSPERFARDLVAGSLKARRVVVGENFRFGAQRAGDLARLRALGAELGFEALVHAVAADARGPYSSTRARDALAEGNLDEASNVLGRPYAVTGRVVHGDARGRTLGFPTANLVGIPEMLPSDGVYAVSVDRWDARFVPLAGGAASIGLRPTIVDGASVGKRSVEVHLLNFSGDLYESRLRVHFRAWLRDEKKFASLDELRDAMANDVERARRVLLG